MNDDATYVKRDDDFSGYWLQLKKGQWQRTGWVASVEFRQVEKWLNSQGKLNVIWLRPAALHTLIKGGTNV